MRRWPVVRLDGCSEIVSGATPSTSDPSFWNGDVCWATPKDLSELGGAYISETARRITDKGLASCSAEVLPPNSVLFSSRAPIGQVAINTVPMATNQGFKSFVPDGRKLDPKYFYYWLRKHRAYLEGLGNGATFKEVSKAVVSRVEIPLPPIEEQRRIAEILDKADALRAKRRAALAQLDTLTQSIFLDIFGNPHSVLNRWPTSKLEPFLTFLTSGSRGWAEHYADEGDLFLRIQNVRKDEFLFDDIAHVKAPNSAEARRTQVATGDVLLSITADLGRTAVVPSNLPRAFISQHLALLRLSGIEPRFVSAFLASPAGARQLQTRNRQGVKAGLNFDDIRSVVIPTPPAHSQRAFTVAAEAVGGQTKILADAEEAANALFASLQHRAFRGEL